MLYGQLATNALQNQHKTVIGNTDDMRERLTKNTDGLMKRLVNNTNGVTKRLFQMKRQIG